MECPYCGRKFYLVGPSAATDDPRPIIVMVIEGAKTATG